MNNAHCGKIRFLTIVVLVSLGIIPVPVQAYDAGVEEIIGNPTATYQKAFDVDVTPEIWNRVLDHLYLMGQLWNVYRFEPAYQVTRTDSGLHVVDPTGIIGDFRQVGGSDIFRCFYGRAGLNHRAIPSFFTADGVILFECTGEQNRLMREVKIFMRGNNWISRAVMKLFAGTLSRGIDNRFINNMENLKKIILDIANDPDKVRGYLAGPLRDDFNKAFPAITIKPAEK